MRSRTLALLTFYSLLLDHGLSFISFPTSRRIVTQNFAVLIEEPPISLAEAAPAALQKKKGPTFQTWTRRIGTKQDKFSLHKISNAGFVVSSTVILASMLLPNEQGQFLQEIPSWLGPFDSMFALSTVVQSMVAIPMVLKHRKADPEVGKTQIEMGFQSMLLALAASWCSPFCSFFLEDHWKLIFGSLILTAASLDFDAAFTDHDDIQKRMATIGVEEADSLAGNIRHFFCFKAQFLIGSLANLTWLVNMIDPAHGRLDWLHLIETGYGLPFCSGTGIPLLYFSTLLSSSIISYQSLLATLSNKKLIPADLTTSLISGSTGVITFALAQLLFARSWYG